jgi:hypothetical protein
VVRRETHFAPVRGGTIATLATAPAEGTPQTATQAGQTGALPLGRGELPALKPVEGQAIMAQIVKAVAAEIAGGQQPQ